MKLRINLTLLVTLLMVFQTASAQIELFQKSYFVQGTDTLPLRILYPDGFDESKSYPVVLLLHGMGERGNDNELQLKHGGKFFSSPETRAQYPAIVVFPQCSMQSFWPAVDFSQDYNPAKPMEYNPFGEPTLAMKLLLSYVDQLRDKKYVDQRRMYLGGISMGGMGTFELLYRRPDVFAAAFPICGGGNPLSADAFAFKVKVWAFHGAKDDVVNPVNSIQMVDAINTISNNAKLTIYPEGGHGIWDRVFAEPDLLKWLFFMSK